MSFAHSRQSDGAVSYQDLADHLRGVAGRAAKYADVFGAGAWARWAGLLHDIGKSSDAFQAYISTSAADAHRQELKGRIDHSSAGAQCAVELLGLPGHVLAYAIAGHHSGLLDSCGVGASQRARLRKSVEPIGQTTLLPGNDVLAFPDTIRELGSDRYRAGFSIAFFTRMIFSCLVDADFLDTEAFIDPERHRRRPRYPDDILGSIAGALDDHLARFDDDSRPISRARKEVREACIRASKLPPGLFSLTVPTGGGKTLSSLAFALRHALEFGKRRVIYVVPFTSIIEQNAAVFREIVRPLRDAGLPDPVLEHHCNAELDGERDRNSRLATENWDAPLVVTTTVQFYESLFANRPSRCRKLHNIAGSVVILDEAQALPVDLLAPTLRAIDELSRCYGVSMVLCTATQPAVKARPDFPIGLEDVREIVPDPRGLYRALDRVDVHAIGELSDDDLVGQLEKHDQVLCVVNTRSHARELFERLEDPESSYHLSAQMCPAHRSEVLARIREQLGGARPCRVISTQLIEAGVDIDFPVVYRSLAGLDAIAQAAGRCNREGRLAEPGDVFVFSSEHGDRERFLAETANVTEQLLPLHENALSMEAIEHYFRQYYWEQEDRWDARLINRDFQLVQERDLPLQFDFQKASRSFRLIEQSGCIVFIPWKRNGHELCEQLRRTSLPGRETLRKLQRYAVSIPERVFHQHLGRGIELIHEQYAVLTCPEIHYDNDLGLVLDRDLEGLLTV